MGWHIVVTEEMRALGLSGNDLMVYALIYGFSQKGQGCFFGSINYICETCGISRKTAHNILKELVERDLLIKEESVRNNVRTIYYKVNEGSVKTTQGVCKNYTGGVQILHTDNIEDNDSSYKKNLNNKGVRFDFKSALISIGVSPQVAEDWMAVRKAKQAANTETAFKSIAKEIELSGRSADECITLAVENSWRGFKAEWLFNQQRSPARPSGKKSVLENNMEVAEQLMRMHINMGK